MNYAWMCPIPLETAVARRPGHVGHVLRGRRLDDLRRQARPPRRQREAASTTSSRRRSSAGTRDAAEYPNLVLIQVWDQRSQDALGERRVRAADRRRRAPTTPTSSAATTLDDLAARPARAPGALRGRHRRAARWPTDFAANLRATIERFNGFAARRRGRGLRPRRARRRAAVQRRRRRRSRAATNPTMWPIADEGPYYAALVTGGHARHQGRPEDRRPTARSLDDLDRPIPGLYGVGNCVASAVGARLLGGRRDARADHRLRLPRRAGERPRGGAGTRGRGPAVGRVVGPVGRRPAAPHYAPRRMSATSAVPRPATVAGRRIDAVEHPGDPARRPIVLLHEGLGSVGLWRGFPAALAAGHRPPRARLLALRPRPVGAAARAADAGVLPRGGARRAARALLPQLDAEARSSSATATARRSR